MTTKRAKPTKRKSPRPTRAQFKNRQSSIVNRQFIRRGGRMAKYDAAATNDDNRRHWANADGLSAAAANSPDIRRILRNRSRYEFANSGYQRRIIRTLAKHTVGSCPRLQMLTNNLEANRQIEKAFGDWAKAVRLGRKLRTMRQAKAMDGEAFAILGNNPRLPTRMQLDLRLIEADQVCEPRRRRAKPDENYIDGILYDDFGNPIAYDVLKEHPGDLTSFSPAYETVPAGNMLHWFEVDRAGQVRGVPETTPGLPLGSARRRYTQAALAAAEAAANFAGVLQTDGPPEVSENGNVNDSAFDLVEMERNALVTMPAGYKLSQLQAQQPTTTYEMFKRELIAEEAAAVEMPYNVASGDSARHNYASGRLDWQSFRAAIDVERYDCEAECLDRILAAWFDEAALLPGILPTGIGPFADWPHAWHFDGFQHVDPVKESKAQSDRLQSYTTNLAIEIGEQGRDWEEVLRQRAKEIALMEELGLPSSGDRSQEEEEDEEVRSQESGVRR